MNNAYYTKELEKFIGWTVVGSVTDSDHEFFGFLLKKPKSRATRAVWFLQDDEGNGPGSFEIGEEITG